MKKILKKNPDIIINFILYAVIIILGILLMIFPALGMIKPVYFVSLSFFTISFFTIMAYFTSKKYNDYELLFISLLNILIASFLFLNQNSNETFTLGTSVLIYTIVTLIIKGFYAHKYKKENNYIWNVKFVNLFLIGLIGILTSINLYNEISVYTIMFGYYYITLGIINLLEPLAKYLKESGYINKVKKKM